MKGSGKLISKGDHGNWIFQIGTNYQWEENGGNGYLRLLKFYPEENKVEVRTYSPYLNQFKITSADNFTIDLKNAVFKNLDKPKSIPLVGQ